MSRPAWMTDDLEEEWVEPEWDAEEDLDVVPEETSSQGSRRSMGGSKERPARAYGSVCVASSSTGSGSDAGSVRERSVRDLLGADGVEGARWKGAPAAGLTLERGAAPSGTLVTPDSSPTAGTFLIREDVPPEPLKAVPAVLGLKKSGVKNFFSPLALERMFEPPSPPANNAGSGGPASQSQSEPQPQSQPRPASPSPLPTSLKTVSAHTQTSTGTITAGTSLTPPKSLSSDNTTPSPHALAYNPSQSFASTSSSPSPSQLSFTPSPSAGRGPLGTFRLPRNPHAPIRPSRLSESHLVKPYASFEGDESSHSSIPQNILDDKSGTPPPEVPGRPEASISPSININEDEDEERLTNDFEFGDDEFEVGDDGEGEGEADSILDPTDSKFEQGGQVQQEKGKGQGGQGKQVETPVKANGNFAPDEILDTDIPGLALFDGRKLSASYQFTFASPRRDEPGPSSRPGGAESKSKRKEDRKREREEERERRNVTRALLHPHHALRSVTPDMDESRPSSRASDVSASGDERAGSPYSENQTGQYEDQSMQSRNYNSRSGVNTSQSHSQFSRDDQRQFARDDPRQLSRDDQRTPSPNLLPPRDPRLKLFQFHYDTFTRDHLSALVDSIAVGSVGSSPSVRVNTMEFRGEDPRALSTPSDAVRYAKKIKLTPPEEYSDWDGERSDSAEQQAGWTEDGGEEEQEQEDEESREGEEEHPRPLAATGRDYASNGRNLMLAMRATRSFESDSVVSATQQSGDQNQDQDQGDLSTGSAATDYRRRGADLMAQIRGELSDEEEGEGGSVRGEGSVISRGDGSVSVRGGTINFGSLRESRAHQQPARDGRPATVRNSRPPGSLDPMGPLAASIRPLELGGQAQGPPRPSPRKLLRRLSAADEVEREVVMDGPSEGVADRAQLVDSQTARHEPPIIRISTAATSELPHQRLRTARGGGRVVSNQVRRIQSPAPAPAPAAAPASTHTHTHLEPRHPSTSPAREDMNRFVSSSSAHTAHTAITTSSAVSFVKHAGPPSSLSSSGVRQIAPTDLPAEALPDRVGRMVYDREAMRWRQEEADGNTSDASEDPFRDFESFRSAVEEEGSDGEGSQPMDEDVDDEEVPEHGDETPRDEMPSFDEADGLSIVQQVGGLSIVPEASESAVESDSDITGAPTLVNVGETSPSNEADDGALKTVEPPSKNVVAEVPPVSAVPEPGLPSNLGVAAEVSVLGTTPMRSPWPLRPALKSAASTPAQSAAPSRQGSLDPSPMTSEAKNRRSVSFSDGRTTGKIRGLASKEIEGESVSDVTSLTLSPLQTDFSPSSRMQRIGNMLDDLEDDSILRNLSIAPGNQSPGGSDEETTEPSDMSRGDPDVDPDVSRTPRAFARTYSFGTSDRGKSLGKGNATFLTECSFGVAHDQLVQLITDIHPYQAYWEPLSEIDLSKKGVESLARLKEFLPNLDRLNVQGNMLTYLSGVPTCLRELNASTNQLTSLTSYAHLLNLEVLDISNNQVDSIAQLKCLRHLRELSAAGNTISDLAGIAHTTSLTKLNLKGNCLKSLSLEDYSWPHVESIDLSNNGLKTLAGLSNLATLVTLNLDHNSLAALCVDGPLSRLRVLRLSDNKLTELDCSQFTNLRTLYADNNRLGHLRHADKARRLENLSLRNQNGRGLHLSVSNIRDIKRMYLSGNPLEPGFLDVPCYNLIYLELAACRLSTLPAELSRLIPNIRVLNLNYNFLSDARPLDGLVRLRKLTMIGSRIKATKPLMRSLQSMKEIEMLDFRMNPFSLGWYLPLLVKDVPGALQPSESTGKHDAPWSDLDVKFRRDLPDELYIGRLAYRGLIMRVCTQLRVMDGIEITAPERAKAQKLLTGIEKSHKAKLSAGKD